MSASRGNHASSPGLERMRVHPQSGLETPHFDGWEAFVVKHEERYTGCGKWGGIQLER
jgi:hypothetical protein